MIADIIPTVSDNKKYVEITLTKHNKSKFFIKKLFFNYINLVLGFNIVGGIDKPHIPGFSEIFVSLFYFF